MGKAWNVVHINKVAYYVSSGRVSRQHQKVENTHRRLTAHRRHPAIQSHALLIWYRYHRVNIGALCEPRHPATSVPLPTELPNLRRVVSCYKPPINTTSLFLFICSNPHHPSDRGRSAYFFSRNLAKSIKHHHYYSICHPKMCSACSNHTIHIQREIQHPMTSYITQDDTNQT